MALGGVIMWALFLGVVVLNLWLVADKRAAERRAAEELARREKRQAESPYWKRLRGKG